MSFAQFEGMVPLKLLFPRISSFGVPTWAGKVPVRELWLDDSDQAADRTAVIDFRRVGVPVFVCCSLRQKQPWVGIWPVRVSRGRFNP